MSIVENIVTNIRTNGKEVKIIFPEGNSQRIQEIIPKLQGTNITPLLVFRSHKDVTADIKQMSAKIIVIEEEDLNYLADYLVDLRKGKLSKTEAEKLVLEPNYFAVLWVKLGKADGMVGGIEYDTKDIIRPALQIIKPRAGIKLVSSFFLMNRNEENYIFTDCALNINPNAEELADIAYLGYEASKLFNFTEARLALLSYSTKGSGVGESVDKVAQAYKILKDKKIDNCIVEGEFQFDSAWDDKIRMKKAPGTAMKNRANIYVFPNLDAGNIGYKIAQRMGGFEAVGPILVGIDKPVNDLSRGATAEDIFNTVVVTAYIHLINKKERI